MENHYLHKTRTFILAPLWFKGADLFWWLVLGFCLSWNLERDWVNIIPDGQWNSLTWIGRKSVQVVSPTLFFLIFHHFLKLFWGMQCWFFFPVCVFVYFQYPKQEWSDLEMINTSACKFFCTLHIKPMIKGPLEGCVQCLKWML